MTKVKLYCPLLLQLIAFWPTWIWYLGRVQDGSDEPWGVVSLITIGLVLWFKRRAEVPTKMQLLLAAIGTTVYLASYSYLPPLLRSVLAITALAPLLSALAGSKKIHLPLLALLLLSLPLIASLQFYLGYPVRVLTAQAASQLISPLGYLVQASGTNLSWAGETVVVDAPCAGIRMLWTGLYLCFTLAWIRDLNWVQTWIAYSSSTLMIFFGNVVRNVLLFFVEAKIVKFSFEVHSLIGLISFALVGVSIIAFVNKNPSQKVLALRAPFEQNRVKPTLLVHALTCWCAAVLPLFYSPTTAAAVQGNFPGWPTEFQGEPLSPIALTTRENEQLSGFPGRVGRFSDGDRELVIRWVTTPTRTLHPAADCLKGSGFSTRPLPIQVDQDGNRWGCVHAERGAEHAKVCERIFDQDNNSFSDVSAWFWGAMMGKTKGPWWAIAVMERE